MRRRGRNGRFPVRPRRGAVLTWEFRHTVVVPFTWRADLTVQRLHLRTYTVSISGQNGEAINMPCSPCMQPHRLACDIATPRTLRF